MMQSFNEIKDKTGEVHAKIFTIQRELSNRYLDNLNMQSVNFARI